MKPRLIPTPWTPEDTNIWLRWMTRHGVQVYACFLSNVQITGDRRDADLMLAIEGTRMESLKYRPADYPYCMVHCLIRAELADNGTFDITRRAS